MLQVHTRVVLSFHTTPDNGFGGGRRGSFLPGVFTVLGMQTGKTFGDAAGSFSISLKPEAGGISLLDLWREPEGVWVMMWFQINGQLFDAMLGNIDTVHEETIRNEDGSRSIAFSISGRDFGKVFAETELFINIFERRGAVPEFALYQALHEKIQFTPSEIVPALINTWIGNEEVSDTIWTLPPSLYGGQPFIRALNLSTIDPNTRGNAQEMTILQPDQQGQKLWDALQEYCNPVLNELWVDLAIDPAGFGEIETPKDPVTRNDLATISVRNLRPAVYLRERPFPSSEFSRQKWDRLPTHDLEPAQYRATSLAKGSSAERFNYWFLQGSSAQTQNVRLLVQIQEREESLIAGDQQIGNPGTVPIYDLSSIRKYGIRRFQQATRFFPINDVTIGELATGMIARWLRLLHDWYSVAPREVTGSIETTYVMPWIRLGHRIRIQRKGGPRYTFYVEGVEHQYQYPGTGHTTLTVTRGEPEGSDLLHEVYQALESAERSTDDLGNRIPGGELTLTQEQARALREVDAALAGPLSVGLETGIASGADPTGSADELGSPPGGERAVEGQPRGESLLFESPPEDPAMNFADLSPSQSSSTNVRGIDDENNPPPLPTDSADPLANTEVSLDDEIDHESLHTVGASIPELDD